MAKEGSLKAAIRNAVDDCIHRNILAEFLKKQRAEVIKVSIYEFDAKKYEGWIREESREEGSLSLFREDVTRGKLTRRAEPQKFAEEGACALRISRRKRSKKRFLIEIYY